jgi:hypothetical protein
MCFYKKILILLVLQLSMVALHGAGTTLTVNKLLLLGSGTRGKAKVTTTEGCNAGTKAFALTLEKETSPCYMTVFHHFKKKITLNAKYSLTFSLRSNKSNVKTFIIPSLVYKDGKKWITRTVKGFYYTGSKWKECSYNLDGDFKLPSGKFVLAQIKFTVNANAAASGTKVYYELSNIKFNSESKTKAKSKFKWEIGRGGTCGKADLQLVKVSNFESKAIKLTLINTEPKNYMTVIANTAKQVAAQKKLCFWIKGDINNGKSFITAACAIQNGKKWKTLYGPSMPIRNSEWKQVVLGFDSDFKLSDAVHRLRQLKFIINSNASPKKHKATVQIAKVQMLNSDEISGQICATTKDFLVLASNKKFPALDLGLPQVKIFFDLDNADLSRKVKSRVSHGPKNLIDNRQTLGYRTLLTEQLHGYLSCSQNLSGSDVIVSARAKTGADAAKIKNAVKAGTNLLIYGNAFDSSLKEILPVKVVPLLLTAIPARSRLILKEVAHPIFKNFKLNDATLGIYYKIELLKGKILAAFADGSPAIVESKYGKGKVLYCAFSPGRNLTDSYFYDESFLRMVYYLSGHAKTASYMSTLSKVMTIKKQVAEAKAVARVLNKPSKKLDGVSEEALRAFNTGNIKEIARLQRKTSAVAKQIKKSNHLEYQLGMSHENFGRFGWLVGEGLLCSTINNKLLVKNGFHEYYLGSRFNQSISLSNWAFKRDGSNNPWEKIIYNYKWDFIGTALYKSVQNIPASWKGKVIYFEVADGIDDIDSLYFNGEKIGATGTDTARYWMAPRKYRIPAKLIKWGQKNTFLLKVTNLRGGATVRSCPKLTVKQRNISQTLKTVSIDWTHKTYEIIAEKQKRYVTMSLLTPFMLYRIPTQSFVISHDNSPEFAAWMQEGKVTVKNLKKSTAQLYKLARDGKFSANWLLLWKKNNSKPQLLIFEKQPDIIEIKKNDNRISAMKFGNVKKMGRVVVGWPFGTYEFKQINWNSGLKKDSEDKIKRLSAMMLNFPVTCEEIFSLDTKRRKVKIINQFKYIKIADEWQTKAIEYAFLPPLATLAMDHKILASSSENIIDFGIPTKFGDLRGVLNKNTIQYELDMPPEATFAYLNIAGKEDLKKKINKLFSGGVRWSCGGRVPCAAWTPANPTQGKINAIDLFAWCFGLVPSNRGRLFLSEENRKKLITRTVQRFQAPIENYQYKAFVRFREEPFSGIRYPVLFNSFFPNNTNYVSGFGSKVIYGDLNEACTVLSWLAALFAQNYGQADFIKTNWSFFKYGMRMSMVYDDWAYNSSGCREYGAGAWIDMLNCEYPGMVNYAAIAKIAGDTQERNNGIYRAAKRMLPSIMRLYFKKYLEKNSSEHANRNGKSEPVSVVVGFNENDGARAFSTSPKGFNFQAAMDIFDMSQGFSADLAMLYKKYALTKIKKYLEKTAYPALLNKDNNFEMRLAYLPPFALWGTSEKTLNKMLADVLRQREKKLMNDWPGIVADAKIGSVIFRQYPNVFLAAHSPLDIRKAIFNPQNKTVNMEIYSNKADSKLQIFSKYRPSRVLINGKKQKIIYSDINGILRLELSRGKSKVFIKLGLETTAQHLILKGLQ